MGFTSLTFLFLFFPLSLLVYYLTRWAEGWGKPGWLLKKLRIRDLLLIAFSLLFYMWARLDNGLMLCGYILIVYGMGRLAALMGGKKTLKSYRLGAKLCLIGCLTVLLGYLVYYKYLNYFGYLVNRFFDAGWKDISLIAPLGISFITFSAVSYVTDIYRGSAKAGSLIDCALYLSFFPKLVSGPIVLWKDFAVQSAAPSLELAYQGVNRIMIGYAKKVLLADQFGLAISKIGTYHMDQPSVLLTILLYMLQIYYDFAAYSDIAIGMANLFGYSFKKNFDFPYRSTSVSEFWRRWHISLGSWFREYVYFPLGGSRRGKLRTLLNLAVVFALTGIWHGAGSNYILWGCINGFFVLLERIIGQTRAYQKTPRFLKWGATMGITLVCWLLFRFQSVSEAFHWLKLGLGLEKSPLILYSWRYFLDGRLITQTVIGVLGATVLGSPKLMTWYDRVGKRAWAETVQQILYFMLFVLSILFMVNSTYSPFIYFQY